MRGGTAATARVADRHCGMSMSRNFDTGLHSGPCLGNRLCGAELSYGRDVVGESSMEHEQTLRAIFSNSSGSPVTATAAAVTDFENICTASTHAFCIMRTCKRAATGPVQSNCAAASRIAANWQSVHADPDL